MTEVNFYRVVARFITLALYQSKKQINKNLRQEYLLGLCEPMIWQPCFFMRDIDTKVCFMCTESRLNVSLITFHFALMREVL